VSESVENARARHQRAEQKADAARRDLEGVEELCDQAREELDNLRRLPHLERWSYLAGLRAILELVVGFEPPDRNRWTLSTAQLAAVQVDVERATAQEPREARWWAARGTAAELRGDEEEAASCLLKAWPLEIEALKTSSDTPLSVSLAIAVKTRVFYFPTRSSTYERAVQLLRESSTSSVLDVGYLVRQLVYHTCSELRIDTFETDTDARLGRVLNEVERTARDITGDDLLGWSHASDFLRYVRQVFQEAAVLPDQADRVFERVAAVEAEVVAPSRRAWEARYGALNGPS
jgi:hypothetical protein